MVAHVAQTRARLSVHRQSIPPFFLFQEPQVTQVLLRSHDFTGLGFNICGNMRDGIFVKDVLHRGPASESKLIFPGECPGRWSRRCASRELGF